MREELEKLVAAGKISRQHIEPLVALATNGYCTHRGWGFGRITQLDTVFGEFLIDFPGKPAHRMQLDFAAQSLKPIRRDHILVRKAEDPNGLREMAAAQPRELVRLVLESYEGRATADQIQQALAPDVIREDWKKWWEGAKRELRKDGHFQVPLKKAEPILYQAQEVPLQDRLLAEFRAVKGLKARLVVAAELGRNLADLTEASTAVTEAVAVLNPEISSHQRTLSALALEAIFMRDDLRAAVGLAATEGELTAAEVWAQVEYVGRVLEQVPAPKHKRALQSFKAARAGLWHEAVLGILNTLSAKLCAECVAALIEAGHLQQLKDHLARLISQHQASSELLLWLAKARSDSFADILGPEVFRATLSAIERDQFNERRANRLRDFLLEDPHLLIELIESADIEVIKDLTRALQLSPSFDDMDKRSLLGRIVKHFPAVQALIAGEHARQDTSLQVSWTSLERRREEYTDLVQKRVPANSRDIAVARSYGDLRENHEYKAAKEAHRLLMRRKAELESDLARARGTDFTNPRIDVAGLGTRVTVTELSTQQAIGYTILGAWDSDPDLHVVSYLTPVAQALMGKGVGAEVECEVDGHGSRYRIDAITDYRAPAEAAVPPATPPAPTPECAAAAPAPAPAPEAPAPAPVALAPVEAEPLGAPATPPDPVASTAPGSAAEPISSRATLEPAEGQAATA